MGSMNAIEKFFVNHRNKTYVPQLVLEMIDEVSIFITGRVLEIGAGLGYTSFAIWDKFHPEWVFVTDFDPAQIKGARKYATARYGDAPSQLEFRREDVLDLSFADSSIDVVVGTLCFHHIEKDRRDFIKTPLAFEQIRRVLKPGGIFIYYDLWNKSKVDEFFTAVGDGILLTQRQRGVYQKRADG
jgi:SAM-dependent methyltransferase